MPRHRNLNLKKFIDSIPEPLVKEYFKQIVENCPYRKVWRASPNQG